MDDFERRLQLQSKLEEVIGSRNVYFQPPETMRLEYPCIVYFKNALPVNYANNKIYKLVEGNSSTSYLNI